jgi:WD40 repeat protein
LPLPVRGKPILFGGDPSGENFLFCLGNSVIIRNIENPKISSIYSEHSHPTTVARYSPDRKFIASADSVGIVRVWHTDFVQGTQYKLKLEKQALSGPIMDLTWDPESKRILAVGQGREVYGTLFFADRSECG